MRTELSLVLDSLRQSALQIARFAPRVLVAIALLLVGWLLARGVRWAVVRVLRLVRLETAAERSGLDDFLLRGGVRFTIVTLVGETVYWGILLIFALAMFDLLGLTMSQALASRLGGYVPNLGAALMVLIFGSLLARFTRGVVEAYLNNVGFKQTASVGLLVHGALISFVVIFALEQLGMAVALLTSAFQLAFGGLCLGLALAFGLGGRTWAESILERTRNRR